MTTMQPLQVAVLRLYMPGDGMAPVLQLPRRGVVWRLYMAVCIPFAAQLADQGVLLAIQGLQLDAESFKIE